jgi:hypothetical protein
MFKLEDLSAICQTMALANNRRSMLTEPFEIEAVLPFPFYDSIINDLNSLESKLIGPKKKTDAIPLEVMEFIDIQFPFNVRVRVTRGESELTVRPKPALAKILPMTNLLKPTGGNAA